MSDTAIEREIIQSHVLMHVFSKFLANDVVLKGGMAMRALYNSPRYTKDIDLNTSLPLMSLQKNMRLALNNVVKQGLLLHPCISEPKQTGTTARWKISGKTHRNVDVHLTVEVSLRNNMDVKPVSIPMGDIGDGSVHTYVDTISQSVMLSTKINALAGRSAIRDMYDINIMITHGVHPDKNVELHDISTAMQNIEVMTYEQCVNELLPFLPERMASRFNQEIFDSMKLSVYEFLDTINKNQELSHEEPGFS